MHPICTACGTQFPAGPAPAACPICTDARQYVPPGGQSWTDLGKLRTKHRNSFRQYEPNLLGIGTTPAFAIDERALLLRRPQGNVLWDCIALLDDATVDIVRGLGGISAIAISHPHYYTTMVEWAHAFDCPIWIHEDDQRWAQRLDASVRTWSGETKQLDPDLTLLRLGGHFAGGQVLHWRDGAEGNGALLTGDIIQVVSDTRWVSFLWSYPNQIPLPAAAVARIGAAIEPYEFDRVYGAFWDRQVERDGKGAVQRSVARYLAALETIAD